MMKVLVFLMYLLTGCSQHTLDQETLKAIIFDVDGVVFKSLDSKGKYLWSQSIKKDLGIRTEHFRKIFSNQWDDVTRGKIDTKDYLKKVFQDDLFDNLGLTPDSYVEYWLSHDNHVDPDMIAFVNSIKIPMYLGTNQDYYRTEHIKALAGNSFNGCFSSYEIGAIKPESKFFEHIEHNLTLSPNQLLLVDDTPANIEGAKARGWNTYLYKGDLAALKVFILSHSNYTP